MTAGESFDAAIRPRPPRGVVPPVDDGDGPGLAPTAAPLDAVRAFVRPA